MCLTQKLTTSTNTTVGSLFFKLENLAKYDATCPKCSQEAICSQDTHWLFDLQEKARQMRRVTANV
jgi:hypothetical protein